MPRQKTNNLAGFSTQNPLQAFWWYTHALQNKAAAHAGCSFCPTAPFLFQICFHGERRLNIFPRVRLCFVFGGSWFFFYYRVNVIGMVRFKVISTAEDSSEIGFWWKRRSCWYGEKRALFANKSARTHSRVIPLAGVWVTDFWLSPALNINTRVSPNETNAFRFAAVSVELKQVIVIATHHISMEWMCFLVWSLKIYCSHWNCLKFLQVTFFYICFFTFDSKAPQMRQLYCNSGELMS